MCWLLEWSVVFRFRFYDSVGRGGDNDDISDDYMNDDDDNDDITDDYLQLGLLGSFEQITIDIISISTIVTCS